MSEKFYVQEDGEQREANEQEVAQILEDAAEQLSIRNEIQAKAEAKASALAKLAALGLTEEEIAAL